MSQALAKKIRRIREGLDWNQEKLAKALGVTQSAVSLWEKGKGEPRRKTLVELAELADIPVVQLIDEVQVHRPADVTMIITDKGSVTAHEGGTIENIIKTTGKTQAAEIGDDTMLPFMKGWFLLFDMSAPSPTTDKYGNICLVGAVGGPGRRIGVVNPGPDSDTVTVTPLGLGSIPSVMKPAFLHKLVGIRTP